MDVALVEAVQTKSKVVQVTVDVPLWPEEVSSVKHSVQAYDGYSNVSFR